MSLLIQDQAGGSSSLKAAAAASTANPIIDDIASFTESVDMAVDTASVTAATVKTEPVAAHSSSSSSSSPVVDTSESLWNTLVNVLQVTPQQEQLLASKVAIAQVSYTYYCSPHNRHVSALSDFVLADC
jgi:hypothetical protein